MLHQLLRPRLLLFKRSWQTEKKVLFFADEWVLSARMERQEKREAIVNNLFNFCSWLRAILFEILGGAEGVRISPNPPHIFVSDPSLHFFFLAYNSCNKKKNSFGPVATHFYFWFLPPQDLKWTRYILIKLQMFQLWLIQNGKKY